jgi:hypothetical protein
MKADLMTAAWNEYHAKRLRKLKQDLQVNEAGGGSRGAKRRVQSSPGAATIYMKPVANFKRRASSKTMPLPMPKLFKLYVCELDDDQQRRKL